MTKQEKIKLEWGELYAFYEKYMDENGFVKYSGAVENKYNVREDLTNAGIEFEVIDEGWYWFLVRPKNLANIEIWDWNRGWVKLNPTDRLPGTNKVLWVYTDKGNVYEYHFYCSYFSISEIENITHYKETSKIEPPLH